MLDLRSPGHIVEGAVPLIAQQPRSGTSGHSGVGDGSAIDEQDVEPAVAVIVEEHATGAHRLDDVFGGAGAVDVGEGDAGFDRDVTEQDRDGVEQ